MTKNPRGFCDTLQANGVLFDNLYAIREDGVATLTDPFARPLLTVIVEEREP